MSLIIYGMKLPKEGRITIEIGSDGAVYSVTKKDIWSEKYESDFPAVELPPHGRLIDADKFVKEARKEYADCWNNGPTGSWMGWRDAAIRADNAPTIIEAEGVKE